MMNSYLRGMRTPFWDLTSRITFLLLATLGVLLFSLPLFSQGNFGRILGTVTDQTGGVISDATVSVVDKDRGVARTLTTDAAGEYNAPTLIPGTYTVRVEAKGFKTMERQNVVLEVGKEIRVDLTVQPGEQTQSVTVTEAVPLVETTNATLGGTLNNAQIQDLPLNGRNYQYLLALRPGVMLQPGGGPWTQSTNNVRPDESVWMVDGVLNVSFYDARPITGASSFITDAATILPIDAIQEFNLEENPKAEYGWKPGAVVNVGIRSGTNTLHGAAYAFGRDQSFDARNAFNSGPDPSGTCVPNPGQPAVCNKLPTTLQQFGGVVGGPIKKDKLFFFTGYEGLRSFIGNAIATSVPTTASTGSAKNSMVDAINALTKATVPVSSVSRNIMGCSDPAAGPVTCTGGLIQNAPAASTGYLSAFPNTNTSDNGVAKIDYRLNSKHMLNGMFWYGHYNGVGEDHAMVNPAFDDTVSIRNWTYVFNWIWTPSSTVVNELRVGYSRNTQKLDPFDQNIVADGKNYPINTGGAGFPNLYIKGFFQGGSLGSWRGRPQDNGPNPYYDVQDSVSYLLGKHALKFGGEFARIEADANVHDSRGRFDFRGGTAFTGSTPLEDFFAGALPGGSFAPNVLVGNAVRTITWNSTAGFIQDDWRLTPKLMVNLGLRYSYTSPFHEAQNLLGNFDPNSPTGLVQQGQSSVGNTLWKPDYRDFSPRLGFAWDVTGKGTTVVRGGASIIYSSFVATFFVQQAGQQNFRGGSAAAVPTGACVGTSLATCQSAGGTIGLGTVFFQPSQVNWNAPAGSPGVFPGGTATCTTGSPCAIQAVDPNLHTPYITNWNLSVTHAFTNNLSLEVGYIGNHGTRLTGFTDINQIPPSTITPATPKGVRPYAASFPYLSFINQMSNDSRSNYNSVQTTLTERVSHGLSFTGGYTYGHGLDNNSLSRFGALPQDSTTPGAEYASSDFDVRNRFTLTASYELPGKKGFGQLLEGWKLNSIVSIQSAQPWNIFDTANNFTGSGDKADRWDFFGNPADFKSGSSSIPYCTGFDAVTGQPITSGKNAISCTVTSGISGVTTNLPTSLAAQCSAHASDPLHATTLAAGGCFVDGNSVMVPPAAGHFGTMGRNIFRDNGFRDWDFSIFKTFTFNERLGAQFRFEVFNLLNRPIIANPNGASNGGNSGDDASAGTGFGCGCATPDVVAGNPIIGSGGARAIQLGLKLTF
jgi:Carboxypeptidase regulatory-like domain/TonB dependent receptor